MIRPIADHAFLSAEPERSVAVLNSVPHDVGINSIPTGQSGPDVAVEPRDTAGRANPQNPLCVLPKASDGIVRQTVFAPPIGRDFPFRQLVEPVIGTDPHNTI